MQALKSALRRRLEHSNTGFKYLLKRDFGISGRVVRPPTQKHNAVLQSLDAVRAAIDEAQKCGLIIMDDQPKNWDSLAALDCILSNTKPSANILDAGAEIYSVILPWLFLFGYRNLEGINLVFDAPVQRGSIIYKNGDITRTSYRPESFDAITSLSVIEHGVDLEAYFREMSRILKPGGVLVTSTDYWEHPIDTQGKRAYGGPVRIFNKADIENALKTAAALGLVPTGNLDLSCRDKVVHWKAVDLDYTFVVFTLRKQG